MLVPATSLARISSRPPGPLELVQVGRVDRLHRVAGHPGDGRLIETGCDPAADRRVPQIVCRELGHVAVVQARPLGSDPRSRSALR